MEKNGSSTGVGVILNGSEMKVGHFTRSGIVGFFFFFFLLWPGIGIGQDISLWEWDGTGVKIHSCVTYYSVT